MTGSRTPRPHPRHLAAAKLDATDEINSLGKTKRKRVNRLQGWEGQDIIQEVRNSYRRRDKGYEYTK